MSKTAAINWDIGTADQAIIEKIALRAHTLAGRQGAASDLFSRMMDVTACHLNGCPLKLDALLAAEEFDFAHDVFGIGRHIDRRNGTLKDCFLPRFAKLNEKDEVAA